MSETVSDLRATRRFLGVLETSKNLSDSILDKVPVVLIITDTTGRVLKANQAALDLIGGTAEGVLGRPIAEIFDGETRERFFDYFYKTTKADSYRTEFEATLSTTGNKTIFLFWNVVPVQLGPGNPGLVLFTGSNTTELRSAHEELFSLAKDLEVGRTVQTMLLPRRDFLESKDFRIAGFYQPSSIVGGDWWWYDLRDDGSLVAFLGDVTGHGISSALVTAIVSGANETLRQLQHSTMAAMTIDEVLRTLHATLHDLCRETHFMPMLAFQVRPNEDKLEFWSAGAPPFFLMTPDGPIRSLRASGNPLGMDQYLVNSAVHDFPKGSRIMMFTDGAYEFLEPDKTIFKRRQALQQIFQACADKDAVTIRDTVSARLMELVEGPKAEDDMTIVVIERMI